MQTKYRNAIPNLDKETQFEKRMINGIKKKSQKTNTNGLFNLKKLRKTQRIFKREENKKSNSKVKVRQYEQRQPTSMQSLYKNSRFFS